MELAQVSFNRWMVKQTGGHTYHKILFRNEEEWTINTHINDSLGNYAEQMKPVPQGHIPYDSIYIFLKWKEN